MLEKPTKKQTEFYDYHECSEYLEKKYGYDERNYAGKTWESGSDGYDRPYQDFWHWVCEMSDLSNDSMLVMNSWWGESATDWQREILERYIDEFGEGDNEDKYILFWVSW